MAYKQTLSQQTDTIQELVQRLTDHQKTILDSKQSSHADREKAMAMMRALEEYEPPSLEELLEWSNRPIFCPRCGELKEETRSGYRYLMPCRCDKDRHQRVQDDATGAPKTAVDVLTFERYYAKSKDQKRAKEICEGFVSDWQGKWLLLMGSPGTGKTHLATATFRGIQKKAISGVYVSYQTLIGEIKNARVNRLDSVAMMDRYKRTGVLLIDDLLKGGATISDRGIINEILDHRYINGLSTIITTNVTFQDLDKIDSALLGRIVEKTEGERMIVCEWEDFRMGGIG